MSGFLAHRWGQVFVADCGARGVRIAPDESRVTCPACKARPADPALWAERDQFAAALRDTQEAVAHLNFPRLGSLWRRNPPGREVVRVERVWEADYGWTIRAHPTQGGKPIVMALDYLRDNYTEERR